MEYVRITSTFWSLVGAACVLLLDMLNDQRRCDSQMPLSVCECRQCCDWSTLGLLSSQSSRDLLISGTLCSDGKYLLYVVYGS